MKNLETHVHAAGLSSYMERIRGLAASAIGLQTIPVRGGDLEIGASRFGGVPDLPSSLGWPNWRDRPMGFIGMLKLSECTSAWAESPLPRSGFLYLWYDLIESPWGFDPADAGSFRIDFIADESVALARASVPLTFRRFDGATDSDVFQLCRLKLTLELTLPDLSEEEPWTPRVDQGDEERYTALQISLSLHGSNVVRHHLLGHPSIVQNPMREECQNASNGNYCGNPDRFDRRRAEQLKDGVQDWLLLAQIDSDEDGPGWMWGDCGIIYYWIRKQDLAACRFDRVWGVLQCY